MMMKNFLVLLVIVGGFFSCSLDDDVNPTFSYAAVPIESVIVPDTLNYGEIHDFEVTYKQISTCHLFETYQSLKDTNERKIFVLNRVFNDNNCEELEDELISKQLHFEVTRQDYYIFKFWQGTDSNNEDIFLTKKIPVKVE